MNLLIAAQIGVEIKTPILFSKDRTGEYLVICEGPETWELRRLKQASEKGDWRHYPVFVRRSVPAEEYAESEDVDLRLEERDLEGVQVRIADLGELPTWLCDALFRSETDVRPWHELCRCLAVLAVFPSLTGLASCVARLRACLNDRRRRSREIMEAVYQVGVLFDCLAGRSVWEWDITWDAPYSVHCKQALEVLWQKIIDTWIPIPGGKQWHQFVQTVEMSRLEDILEGAVFAPIGRDWRKLQNWQESDRVKVTPRQWWKVT